MVKNLFNNVVCLICVFSFLTACNSSSDSKAPEILENDSIYFGKNATHEIIQVESEKKWIVKSDLKDDSNYNVLEVKNTGEKIDKYPIINLTVTDVSGDIESSFGTREGRKFILLKESDEIHFIAAKDEYRDEIENNIEQSNDPIDYLKSISKYDFYLDVNGK
ncbi:hypothetical protein B4065_1366 [Caldibacillus thermoamylovorans]|uniref:hypothetical protein n=1 Tax=Caldibacillus thermoamylovorans TaxID=35841 RepID=UPI0005A4304F|nr:hypothetical protein [Caldibacillus thermoamylovorans]KIO69700.1 hypothetical protein B4065_1366 [Caldibacillus thermoamylovorans]